MSRLGLHRLMLHRLNESRDSEIRMLADHSWSEINDYLDDLFISSDDLYQYGWSLCEIVDRYLMNAFEKESFFIKNTEIDYYDAVSDNYARFDLKYSDTRACALFNKIDVSSNSVKMSIYTRLYDLEEKEFIKSAVNYNIVEFRVKYDIASSTVSDVIESVLNELDKYMSKIISYVKDEILSLNKDLRKRLDDIYKRISDTYTRYKHLCNEFEELGGDITSWENIGKNRIDSSI